MLGCIRDGCIARMWNYVDCPSCDFMWSFNEAGTSTGQLPSAAGAASAAPALPDLEKAFAQLDQFCAHMLAIPGAANFPDLKAQIDFIQMSKEKARLAQVEELAAMQFRLDRVAANAEEAKKRAEANRKNKEERDKPLPPLDGGALGEALLKNLGFK